VPADLQFGVETPTPIRDVIGDWLPRLAVAVLFLLVGGTKFERDSTWVGIFARIGFGDWFRYLAGTMQVAGAVLVLIPRTVVFGAALIACTLAGAVIAQVVVFHSIAAIIPGLLLVAVTFVGVRGWTG
jgi:putative oxidoreductase